MKTLLGEGVNQELYISFKKSHFKQIPPCGNLLKPSFLRGYSLQSSKQPVDLAAEIL
jgi:hypothetical protein